jgi:hypothetical protein
MSVIRDLLRQYWTHSLAIVVFLCAAVRYWQLGNYLDEDHLQPFLFTVAGLTLVALGDEWTAMPSGPEDNPMADADWPARRSFTYHTWLGPVLGGIALTWGTVALYRL